jgi:GT2 family glycosyltransferase
MIDKTLDSLCNQNYDMSSVKVIVVGVDKPNLVKEDQFVKMVSTGKGVSPSIARNIGIEKSSGDIICFTDADCLVSPDWLAKMTTPIKSGEAKVVGGSVRFDTSRYWTLVDNISWFHDFLESKSSGSRQMLPTLNMCLHRSVIDEVGLLNEGYSSAGGEDAEWSTRMRQNSIALHFLPDAYVWHCPSRTSFRDVWRHAMTYGSHSMLVNPNYRKYINPPFFISNRWLMLLFILPISLVASFRIYYRDKTLKQFWHTFPGVFLTKIAWCIGAANPVIS